jgi:glycosyltransferase involved in cell wall biosynthesis
MHIVIDARMIDASGIGVYLQNVLTSIIDDYNITLLGDPVKLARYNKKAAIIPLLIPIYSLKEQLALSKVIPDCDIFWSPHYNIPLFKIKAKDRVVTIHDVYHLAFSKQLSYAQRIYANVVIKAAVKLSGNIITVSNFSKNEIIKYTGCNISKISVIYNGVKNHGVKNDFNTVSEKYKLPNKYVLYVGNVKPHKNLKKLLEAYLLLNTRLQKQYKIVIVGKKDGFITGDSTLFGLIKTIPGLIDSIVFTGFVDDEDISTIYHNASVFVFPSIYEGFGFPPLEAMSNGCPVIVSNKSSMPEICENAVIYFDPFNENEISEKLSEVLTNKDLQHQLIKRGKLLVENFKWETAASKHKALFDYLMNKSIHRQL